MDLDQLRAAIDEDERVAREATPGSWWIPERRPHEVHMPVEGMRASVGDMRDATHIARHDPARALRWVRAAREILDEHEPSPTQFPSGRPLTPYCRCCSDKRGDSAEDWPCPTVRSLMSVYGDTDG